MLTRRKLLETGGLAALAAGLNTCTTQRIIINTSYGEKIEKVINDGIEFLRQKEYDMARAHFEAYKDKLLVSTDKASSSYSVKFLYAMSNIPGASLFNGRLETAGRELTDLFHKIEKTPNHLESMQNDLVEFFELPEYPAYKKRCQRLRGRFQMFPFIISLIEQDYEGAKKALMKAYPHLDPDEQHKVSHTLQILADRAEMKRQNSRELAFESLYKSIE